MKLSNSDLQRIYDLAKHDWQHSSNTEIEAHLYPAACLIVQFVNLAQKRGVDFSIQIPSRPLEHETDD